jgi:Family of unknown function (DUF695)
MDRAQRAAIVALWAWWSSTGASQAAHVIASGELGEFAEDMTSRLNAIDPRLQWELAKAGAHSEHALCISAGGVAELRGLAERCVRAAPLRPPTWEYLSARRSDPAAMSYSLRLGDREVEFSALTVSLGLQARQRRLDVVAHHPQFTGLPTQEQVTVVFMALDHLLGEDGVERWVGEVKSSIEPSQKALPLVAVLDAVNELEEHEAGEDPWVELKGKRGDGALAVIKARRPMRWIDNPTLGHHLAVRVPYKPGGADGQPDETEGERLGTIAAALSNDLGEGGLLIADVRCAGRCDLHAYYDEDETTAAAAAKRWVKHGPRGSEGEITHDPGWRKVRPFS